MEKNIESSSVGSTEASAGQDGVWVFGYGSLIWRPDFAYVDSQLAVLSGYQRRFCQASHDHRGTVQLPGRVVTLASTPGAECVGMAFLLAEPSADSLAALEIREQDGYQRTCVSLSLGNGHDVRGVTWIASPGNPSWRGNETLNEVATLIATRQGPSGTNWEYLFELERALQKLGIRDDHVTGLSDRVKAVRK